MEKIKCNRCGFDGLQNFCFNFNKTDLEQIQKGVKIMPSFRIGLYCSDCGKWIKWLPFKDNLVHLNNKFIKF